MLPSKCVVGNCVIFVALLAPRVLSVLPCSITNLQTELSLVCEERDKLTQELKRTPDLIENALADLKEQCEHHYHLVQYMVW